MKWLTILSLLASVAMADDLSLARARARAAMVQVDPVWLPPVPESKPQAKPDKPKVYVVYASFHCPPCEQMKAEKWDSCPFELTPTNTPHVPAKWFPWVYWKDSSGQWRYLEQWNGKASLVKTWQNTQGTKREAGDLSQGYRARWTYPKPLSGHLQSVHGVNTSGMTVDQMELLHDQLHEGKR